MRAIPYAGMDRADWPSSYASAHCAICGCPDDLTLVGGAVFECRRRHAPFLDFDVDAALSLAGELPLP